MLKWPYVIMIILNQSKFFSLITFSKATSLWPVNLTYPQRVTRLLLDKSIVPSSLTSQMEIWTEDLSLEVMTLSVQSHFLGRQMSVSLCLSLMHPFILVSVFWALPASIGDKYSNLFIIYPSIHLVDSIMGDRFLVGGDEARYKIILVGDVSVGKTAMFWRYTEGEFLAHKDTMVTTIDFKMKCTSVNNKPVKLYVWDTAGSEKYRSIVSTYFKGCHGVVIVFDLSREESFKSATEQWYQTAKSKTPNSVFLLVGNKCDLDIRVNEELILAWSKKYNIPYIQTSVKENKNIVEVFDSLAKRIYEAEHTFNRTQSVSLNKKESQKSKGKCCGSS